MQVSAVNDGGKGKKGKNKMTESKERDSWNSGRQQVQFQGYCSHWSKWRHKRADCRNRLAQQKAWCSGWYSEPESEVDGVKSAQWSDRGQ